MKKPKLYLAKPGSEILLPKKGPFAIRTSGRSDFKHCQWYWWMHWVEGWSPKRAPTWSWFGTAWHKAMEARYPVGRKRGSLSDMWDAFQASIGEEQRRMSANRQEIDGEELVEARALAEAMLRGYVNTYGKDAAWEVIHTEQSFQIDVPDDAGRLVAVYCGTWDLLVWDRFTKTYRLVDHKTTKRIEEQPWLTINDQAGSYLWVAPEVLVHLGLLKPTDYIDGIVFNYAKKAMPDNRPRNAAGQALNKDGTVSARQPARLFYRQDTDRFPQERVRQARRVMNEAAQMRAVLQGKFEPTKRPSKDCRTCPFFDVCELHEQDDGSGEWRELLEATFVRADPYADHREGLADGSVYVITTKE